MKASRGFTLVETMVACAVLSLAVLALFEGLTLAARLSRENAELNGVDRDMRFVRGDLVAPFAGTLPSVSAMSMKRCFILPSLFSAFSIAISRYLEARTSSASILRSIEV